MRYLALITYSVFLWQGVVITALARITHLHRRLAGESFLTLSTAAFYVVVLAVTCLVATVSYLVIERQARLLRPRQKAPPAQPAPPARAQPSAPGQP
jgi:peptidoglycan/LPS O-acetylase OafA/YrhL